MMTRMSCGWLHDQVAPHGRSLQQLSHAQKASKGRYVCDCDYQVGTKSETVTFGRCDEEAFDTL